MGALLSDPLVIPGPVLKCPSTVGAPQGSAHSPHGLLSGHTPAGAGLAPGPLHPLHRQPGALCTDLQPCCVDLQDQCEPFCLPHGLQSHCRPPPLITLSPQELCWEGRELGHEEDREELNAAEVGTY